MAVKRTALYILYRYGRLSFLQEHTVYIYIYYYNIIAYLYNTVRSK